MVYIASCNSTVAFPTKTISFAPRMKVFFAPIKKGQAWGFSDVVDGSASSH
jgi:hypothetical protein